MNDRWRPLGTRSVYGPPPVGLIAYRHGVWQVLAVQALERALWNDTDEQRWSDFGMPEPWPIAMHPFGPFRVEARHVGGVNPNRRDLVAMTVHSTSKWREPWRAYPRDRWPMCSCCGQPVPCTAELLDQQVDAEMLQLEGHAAKLPGCCWACSEPISSRQRSVVYPGINLDSPTGPEVRFHTRHACARSAERYEQRWIAAQHVDAP